MTYSLELDPQVIIILILVAICIILYVYNNYFSSPKVSVGASSEAERLYLLKKLAQLKQNKIINIHHGGGGYVDPVTREDEKQVHDDLTYPYTRLPRYIIDQNKMTGFYESGAFGSASNYFDDTEKIVGNIILDPTVQGQNLPAFPIYEKPSATNRDRYFYYIIDTRLQNNHKIKVPLDNIVVNGRTINNAVDNGIDQLMTDDSLEILNFNFAPGTLFRAKLYPRQSGLYYNPYLSGHPITSKYSK